MKREDLAELKALLWDIARKRETELSGCSGKVGYLTRSDAIRAIRPHKRRFVHPYRCPICNHWHAGGAKPRLKRLAEERLKCASL